MRIALILIIVGAIAIVFGYGIGTTSPKRFDPRRRIPVRVVYAVPGLVIMLAGAAYLLSAAHSH